MCVCACVYGCVVCVDATEACTYVLCIHVCVCVDVYVWMCECGCVNVHV